MLIIPSDSSFVSPKVRKLQHFKQRPTAILSLIQKYRSDALHSQSPTENSDNHLFTHAVFTKTSKARVFHQISNFSLYISFQFYIIIQNIFDWIQIYDHNFPWSLFHNWVNFNSKYRLITRSKLSYTFSPLYISCVYKPKRNSFSALSHTYCFMCTFTLTNSHVNHSCYSCRLYVK